MRVVLPKHVKAEMRVESVISSTNSLIAGHLTIRLNAMLEAEKLPASIADLDTSLTWVIRECSGILDLLTVYILIIKMQSRKITPPPH